MRASVNEYGTLDGHIPERSFIRDGFDKIKSQIIELIESGLPKVITGKLDPNKFYDLVGEGCVSLILKYFDTATFKANAPSTIKQKGSSRPLVDTGHMRQAITYKVVSK